MGINNKPTVGGSDGTWGTELNSVLDSITPMTTVGDMIYASAVATGNGIPQRLPVGSNNQILTSNGSIPTWASDITVNGNLTISGSLIASGSVFYLSASNLIVDDPLLYIANNNSSSINDIGIIGHFTSGIYQHTGLVRRASDNIWRLFSGVSTEPTTTVNFASAVYDTLLIGGLLINSSSTVQTASISPSGSLYVQNATIVGTTNLGSNIATGSVQYATTASNTTQTNFTALTLSGSNVLVASGSISTASNSASLGGQPAASYALLNGATFTGGVNLGTASGGTVGGWIVSASSLNNNGSASSYAGLQSASTASYAFFAGATSNTGVSSTFSVTPNGTLTANSASILGVVTFTSGSIGPFAVSSSAISGSTGNITASNVNLVGNITASTGLNSLGHTTFTGGTTTEAPMDFASGSLLSVANGGAIEYDGRAFYFTPEVSASGGRGVVPSYFFTSTSAVNTLTSNIIAQNIFPITNDTIFLAGSTTYEMEMSFQLFNSGSVAHSLQLNFGGNVGISSIGYTAIVGQVVGPSATFTASSISPSASTLWSTSSVSQVLAASTASAVYRSVFVKGLIRTNTTGSFIPQIILSASPTGLPVVQPNAYMKITPLGSNTLLATNGWI